VDQKIEALEMVEGCYDVVVRIFSIRPPAPGRSLYVRERGVVLEQTHQLPRPWYSFPPPALRMFARASGCHVPSAPLPPMVDLAATERDVEGHEILVHFLGISHWSTRYASPRFARLMA
jgi:hypothetical protein